MAVFSYFTAYFISFICIWITFLNGYSVECLKICAYCDQGLCINETCTCLPGWRGANCDECYGRISLPPRKEGVIHDGAANYSKDITCSWLLDAESENMRVRFVINDFKTECIWDHLYVHDGDSAFAPLVSAFSGVICDGKDNPEIKFKLTGRYTFIHFYSDAALTLQGFNISYFIDDCALECSNGVCNNSVCICKQGWTGQNCDSLIEACPFNCSNHGVCEFDGCHCFEGYTGYYCNASRGELLVESLQVAHSLMTGRASFSFVPDDSGRLWVLGGYKMGDINLTNNLFRFDIKSRNWTIVEESLHHPWPRYGHSTVFYQGGLYLYGGVNGTVIKNDLWLYSISNHTWTHLVSGPRSLSGHTSHIVDDMMVIIFGYSSDYGYSNKVLEYNFAAQRWTVAKTIGSVIQGAYGHTSVYDTDRRRIYVYGGYQSFSSYQHADQLYQYDPRSREWFILQSSGSAQYLHSAAMMNGLMLVFGGNTLNETQLGKQCFASDFMIYDIDCNSWHTVRSSYLGYLVDKLDRFGHMATSVNNVVYIFGGFDSFLKNDLLIVTEGNCTFYKEQQACESAIPGIKCQWKSGQCMPDNSKSCHNNQDQNASCSGYNTCSSCQNSSNLACRWCGTTCSASPATMPNCSTDSENCTENINETCGLYQTCKSCVEHTECSWQTNACTAKIGTTSPGYKQHDNSRSQMCPQKPCSEQHSCDNCTTANCMWCPNLAQCIDTNAYVVSFHYGQCMGWITRSQYCLASNCSKLATCADCQAKPKCGWCNDESGTGTGVCLDGGMMGPIKLVDGKPHTHTLSCPADRWFFNSCPKCQCNGHSICLNGSSVCEKCEFPTTGPQCQFCSEGYYGSPQNGAGCKQCTCNDQADSCNSVDGSCFCRTRGVTGKFCERCDESSKYSGDPRNGGTCYYQLNTDFQYTFNLTKNEEVRLTQINFLNTPTSSDRDVDFTLNCSSVSNTALLNITYKSKSSQEEKVYVNERQCDYFHIKFDHKNHAFAGKENTTFFVYVYNFKTPFMIQISFSQFPKIDLVHFFVTFFSCFLSLLLIAAALWKIKHKYDGYRRRQQLIVEMQQMASRPFSTIAVEIDKKLDPTVTDKKDHLDSVLRRRKKMNNKPSAIAIEPLSDHKAAILTLLIQLPYGDLEYAPSGQSGLSVGSALVSIGSNRKQSLEHIKGDKGKIRKNLPHGHLDACA